MLTRSAGSATSVAAVPRTYIATTARPESTTPCRSVAAASWISSPKDGASSSPANANVIVAKKLTSWKSNRAGNSCVLEKLVALPRLTSDQPASRTKIAAGSQVP